MNNKIQDQIDKSAKMFIFTYGIRDWNMDQFAKEAGITKRTLYKYVDSKEKLVKNTIIKYIKEIQNELNEKLKGISDFQTGIEQILNIYPSIIKNMDSIVVKDIFNQYPSIEDAVVKERDNFTKDILIFIRKGQKDEVIDKKIDAEMILDVMQSLIIYYIKNQPEQIEEKLKISMSMMIYGIIQRGD